MAAARASCQVLFASSQAAISSASIAMIVPPRSRNAAGGAFFRLRKTGSERQVAPYVTSRAMALIVSAATKELLRVNSSMIPAVIRIAT